MALFCLLMYIYMHTNQIYIVKPMKNHETNVSVHKKLVSLRSSLKEKPSRTPEEETLLRLCNNLICNVDACAAPLKLATLLGVSHVVDTLQKCGVISKPSDPSSYSSYSKSNFDCHNSHTVIDRNGLLEEISELYNPATKRYSAVSHLSKHQQLCKVAQAYGVSNVPSAIFCREKKNLSAIQDFINRLRDKSVS